MVGIPLVLYEDERFVAVDKPGGVLVVRGRGAAAAETTLVEAVVAAYGYPRLWPVHRLDRGTSGVVLLARSAGAHRVANEAFASRRVRKRYAAVVRGVPRPPEGAVDAPLAPDLRRRGRGGTVVDPDRGKASRTEYRVVQELGGGRAALVHAAPHTGRTHQIRVHMAHLGHPILQDDRYGCVDPDLPLDRPALHAAELALPALGLSVSAPLPADLRGLLEALDERTRPPNP